MIEMFGQLWELLTIFFNTEVIYNPLFMAMLLLITIFFAVYYLIQLMDIKNW